MIKDSISEKRRIGVSHTLRVVTPKKMNPNATLLDQLNSNQETYEAYPIFSAGFAEILETLPDGRLVVQISMDSRYEIVHELQQIPYKVVNCKPYLDRNDEEGNSILNLEKMRRHLDQLFVDLAHDHTSKEVMEIFLKSEEWQRQSMEVYSYAIYSLVIIESDVLQRVLELQSINERINFLIDKLSGKFLQ